MDNLDFGIIDWIEILCGFSLGLFGNVFGGVLSIVMEDWVVVLFFEVGVIFGDFNM